MSLTPDSNGLWGKMNVHQMLCHCSDQIKLALGDLSAKPIGGWFHRTVLRFMVLYVIKIPKGKVPTVPEINQQKQGTKPVEFEADRKVLLDLISRFLDNPDIKIFPHPAFGNLNRKEWSRMMYSHIDHHLEQFGV